MGNKRILFDLGDIFRNNIGKMVMFARNFFFFSKRKGQRQEGSPLQI